MRDLDFGRELIKKKIPLVSNSPGVYRMLDKKNQVLYVGKAKNLPNRLKSYATDKNQTIRTERMLALTNSLEIVTTSSEAEALLLEANLIKKFKPKFNVLLRDDKSFPYIFISSEHDFPRIEKHRGPQKKRGRYYGPFASPDAVTNVARAAGRPNQPFKAGLGHVYRTLFKTTGEFPLYPIV